MANPWFRLYSEFMHDPKVQMLSEQYQRRLIMVLCMRCNSDVTLQDKYVTFTLRISQQEWDETKAVFVDAGFIDSDNNVLNWDKRQYVSDSSAARVAKHRALHKAVDVTASNVTVTPPEQNRTEQNIDKDVSKKPFRKKNKTPISKDFTISDNVRAWAKEHGHTRLEDRLAHFMTVSKAKAYEYADWDAAFRNAISGDWAKLGGPSKSASGNYDKDEFMKRIGAIPT